MKQTLKLDNYEISTMKFDEKNKIHSSNIRGKKYFFLKRTNFHIVCGLINIFFLITVFSISSNAQTILTGIIYNKQNKGVQDASVILQNVKDSTVVGYCFSNQKGNYEIIYYGNVKHLMLTVTSFNIKKQSKIIDNKSQNINFIVEESLIELKGVTIKSPKIWGTRDTINYLVGAYSDRKDIVIGDVLKKLPGIKVKENGEINYKGKPINKFYIEDMDMLQGRYGIATNNISAQDISIVQVLENHQPIKALQDIEFSSDAAINLKIKKGAKGIYSIMALLGMGYDEKTLIERGLTGMYFSKKHQHIYTYKGNNSGNDIFKEQHSHNSINPLRNNQLTYLIEPHPPAILKNRYYNNNSNAVSLNNIRKLKNEDKLTYNFIYYNDFEKRKSFSLTSFIIPGDSIKTISENLKSTLNVNHLEGEFSYLRNKKNNYLNTYLNISSDWKKGKGDILNTTPINQILDNNTLNIANKIYWIKRNKNKNRKGININSSNYYRSQPQELLIAPGLYSDIFNSNNSYDKLLQKVSFNSFMTKNYISLLSVFVLGNLSINPSAGFSVQNQSLQTNIYKFLNNNIKTQIKNNNMSNDENWTKINTSVSLNFIYNFNKLNLNANFPLNYKQVSLRNDEGNDKNIQQKKIYLQPSISFTYKLGYKFKLNGSYFFYNQSPDLHTLYSGYILQNYRSLNFYENKLTDSYGNGSNFDFSYTDIINMTFAKISIAYHKYKSDVIYSQNFDEMLIKTYLVEKSNSGDRLSLSLNFSKSFYWKGLTFSFESSWGKSSSPQLRQDKLVQYINKGINTNCNFHIKLTPWLLCYNKSSLSYIKGKTNSGEKFSDLKTFINLSSVDVQLSSNIMLNTSYEYYHNQIDQNNPKFSFANIDLKYTCKKNIFSLSWQNIFNTKKYISAFYGNMNSYYSQYTIRPSSIILKAQFKLK